jgi:Bacteriophage clamp loader A subunit
MNPFDYVKSINDKTENLIDRDTDCEKSYIPFIVNRSFSQFSDTVLLANTMNGMHHLDKKLQYDYLWNTIKKRKRFSKWCKPDWNEEEELMVASYYTVSRSRAREYLSMMDDQDKQYLTEKTNTGGVKKH